MCESGYFLLIGESGQEHGRLFLLLHFGFELASEFVDEGVNIVIGRKETFATEEIGYAGAHVATLFGGEEESCTGAYDGTAEECADQGESFVHNYNVLRGLFRKSKGECS